VKNAVFVVLFSLFYQVV